MGKPWDEKLEPRPKRSELEKLADDFVIRVHDAYGRVGLAEKCEELVRAAIKRKTR